MSALKKPCRAPGCPALVRPYGTGWCPTHYRTAGVCADEGCSNPISGQNRKGYCRDHYAWGAKLQRLAQQEAREK